MTVSRTFCITLLILAVLVPIPFAHADSKLPKWVKNTFIWYGEDKISEDELLNAIKFLVENKVIDISQSTGQEASSNDILSLPHSWTQNNIQITLLGLYPITNTTDIEPGHKQYEVHIKWKNLLSTTNMVPDDCIGFDDMKLETDTGNVEDLFYVDSMKQCGGYYDSQTEIVTTSDVFDTSNTESPKLLHVNIMDNNYTLEAKVLQ